MGVVGMSKGIATFSLVAVLIGCNASQQIEHRVEGKKYGKDYLEGDLPAAFRSNHDGRLTHVSCIAKNSRQYSCLGNWLPADPQDRAAQRLFDRSNGLVGIDVTIDPHTGEYHYEFGPG
jgi:hypothetical protein